MDEAIDRIEYEAMLLSRHHLSAAQQRGSHGLLERSAYVVLNRLRVGGPLSIAQLSEALGLDASTLSRQTAPMVREGLVERVPDPDGGMARKLRMTTEGERRLEADRTTIRDALADILGSWPSADVAELASYLHRFNAAIETRTGGRAWPMPSDRGALISEHS